MDQAAEQLRATYSAMTTEELVELRAREDLTLVAYGVLDEELKDRGVADAPLQQEISTQREVQAQRRRVRDSLAGRGTRFVAYLIDFLGTLVGISFLVFAVFLVTPLAVSDAVGRGFILCWVMYLLFKDGFQGQSIGKRLLRIRVVEVSSGETCSLARSAARNVFHLFGLIDWVCALGENRQRLGDMVAGTCVVRASKDGQPRNWPERPTA